MAIVGTKKKMWLQPAMGMLAYVADAVLVAATLLSMVIVARTLYLAQEQIPATVLDQVALVLNVTQTDVLEKEVHPHYFPQLV